MLAEVLRLKVLGIPSNPPPPVKLRSAIPTVLLDKKIFVPIERLAEVVRFILVQFIAPLELL